MKIGIVGITLSPLLIIIWSDSDGATHNVMSDVRLCMLYVVCVSKSTQLYSKIVLVKPSQILEIYRQDRTRTTYFFYAMLHVTCFIHPSIHPQTTRLEPKKRCSSAMRHRTGNAMDVSSSSSSEDEDDDVFNKNKGGQVSNKNHHHNTNNNNNTQESKKKKKNTENDAGHATRVTSTTSVPTNVTASSTSTSAITPNAITTSSSNISSSSTKRHHYQNPNSSRAAKMEALIQQLEMDSQDLRKVNHASAVAPSTSLRDAVKSTTKGSYCINAHEEQTTTNIFVGNLSPLITEEDLYQVFSQYGALYSVKIMWPRTTTKTSFLHDDFHSTNVHPPHNSNKSSHTGFVCFMDRQSAQNAMDHLDNVDIRNTGRRIYLNWGKPQPILSKDDVHHTDDAILSSSSIDVNGSMKSFATIGTSTADSTITTSTPVVDSIHDNSSSTPSIPYNPTIHAETAIRIVQPSDPKRCQFIDTIAYHVSQDGSVLEDRLRQDVTSDTNKYPDCEDPIKEYAFLFPWNTIQTLLKDDPVMAQRQDILQQECLYYRWRVYAFTQESSSLPHHHDHPNGKTWRTEPFQMFHQGPFWIPPPLPSTSNSIHTDISNGKNNIALTKYHSNTNRSIINQRGYVKQSTSNRIDYKIGRDGRFELTDQDMAQWKDIVNNLIGSKESICEAMSFCFDRSAAAVHVSSLLKEALLDSRAGTSIDTMCARLFLLSDVLYNSQQPGVKNAFQFRTSIESMAKEVFQSLGQNRKWTKGRMTMNKLRNAVRAVLSAWNDWSVFVPEFLDELEALFEGREIPKAIRVNETMIQEQDNVFDVEAITTPDAMEQETFISHMPSSIWMSVDPTCQKDDTTQDQEPAVDEYKDYEYVHLIDAELDGQSLGDSEIEDDYQVDIPSTTVSLEPRNVVHNPEP
jgi:U2-associated protein SR140